MAFQGLNMTDALKQFKEEMEKQDPVWIVLGANKSDPTQIAGIIFFDGKMNPIEATMRAMKHFDFIVDAYKTIDKYNVGLNKPVSRVELNTKYGLPL